MGACLSESVQSIGEYIQATGSKFRGIHPILWISAHPAATNDAGKVLKDHCQWAMNAPNSRDFPIELTYLYV
jgi:hypothetical protein